MRTGLYGDSDVISRIPGFIYQASLFVGISSLIVACSSKLLGGASSDVFNISTDVSLISLFGMWASFGFYANQKSKEYNRAEYELRRKGLYHKNKEGKRSMLAFKASTSVALGSVISFLGAMMLSGASLDVGYALLLLGSVAAGPMALSANSIMSAPSESGYVANSKSQGTTGASLDEGSERTNYSFLKQLNLIGKLSHRKKPSVLSNLLEEFKADEDTVLLMERINRRNNFSGAGYGAAGKTTSVL